MGRLRQVQTAFVLDQFPATGVFHTEPYEAGWASEAIAFVYVRSAPAPAVSAGAAPPALQLRVEVSADGQRWIDDETAFPPITRPGGYRLRLTHFGNWLRLAGSVTDTARSAGTGEPFVIDLYWVFKE